MDLATMHHKIKSWFSAPEVEFGFDHETGQCAYRVDDNTRCAVGVLIDDKHYDSWKLEGRNANELLRDGLGYLVEDQTPEDREKAIRFLVEAQGWHDARARGEYFPPIFEGETVRFSPDDRQNVETGMEFFLQDLKNLAVKYEIPA